MNAQRITPHRPQKFGGTSILIIEDNPDHLYLIKMVLEESIPGMRGISLSSRELVEEYMSRNWQEPRETLPRLVLLDLYLPTRADGISTLQALKAFFKEQEQAPIPVVVFSHSNHAEDIQLCYKNGANAYLVKSPDYHEWKSYFEGLRDFWLETASLPPRRLY